MPTNPKEYMRAWRASHPSAQAEYSRRWRQDHPDEKRLDTRDYCRENKEKRRAQKMVAAALKAGLVERQPCEVCGDLAQAHHDDYAKPLDVRWLCAAHHKQHHVSLL